jgi:hypothetical protein
MQANRFAAVLLLVGICATGCGAEGGQEQRGVRTAPTRQFKRAPVDVARAALTDFCGEANALAGFGAGDGFTFAHALAICKDGSARLAYSEHFPGRFRDADFDYRISARDVRGVEAALEHANLASLRKHYRSPGADFASYRITYGSRTVWCDSPALESGEVPARLVRVISYLRSILDPIVADAGEQFA